MITIALIKKERKKNQFGVDMNLINVRHFLEQLLYLSVIRKLKPQFLLAKLCAS